MATSVTWNGTTYSIPTSGELNWASLSSFLIALGTDAATSIVSKQAVRVATTTPVTVSNTADFAVISNLASAGPVAVSLPAGATGRIFAIMDGKLDAATNNITITPNGAETINGAATFVLNHAGQMVLIQFISGNWQVLVNNLKPGTILDADIIAAAGIARSKIAAGTAHRVLANTSTGAMGENAALSAAYPVITDANGQLATEAYLDKTRGGTGITSTATFPASGTVATLAGTETFSGKSVTTDLKFANEAIAKFYEATGGDDKFIGIKAPSAVTADKTFILPDGDGSAGQVLTTNGSLALGWASPSVDKNLSLVATVGSSNLTVALKTAAGADPSAGSPVILPFRSATLATGTVSNVSITAATSIVLESGSSLGMAIAANYIQVYAINNAGTVELALVHGGGFSENTLVTTTDITGSGADTSGLLYSNDVRTNVACRYLGRVKILPAASHAWDNAPTEISLEPVHVGVLGDTSGSAASAGYVGETIRSYLPAGSKVLLNSSGQFYTVTSITLTAGNYDISGVVQFVGTTTAIRIIAGIGTEDGNSSAGMVDGDNAMHSTGYPTANSDYSLAIPQWSVSPTATATYYLKAFTNISTGSMYVYGRISARRAR